MASRAYKFRAASGLTFVEVLFAVAILGIGFIMVASMFAVAARQTQETVEETAGATVGPAGLRMIQEVATSANMPPTGVAGSPAPVMDLRSKAPAVWDAIRRSLVLSREPQYAWVPLYRRGAGENYATVIVLATQSRLTGIYSVDRDTVRFPDETSSTPAVLEPKQVEVKLVYNPSGVDEVTVSSGAVDAVAPGTFIVLANDPGGNGAGNGAIYRVGRQLGSGNFELIPGFDLKTSTYRPTAGSAYVLGRGWADPLNPGTYDGAAQDIAAYVSLIRLN